MKRYVKRGIVLLILVVLVGYAARSYMDGNGKAAAGFRTAAVVRGDLVATISATGTVEPEEVIDVGSQVAGKIVSFGKDLNGKPVDYGSEIDEGTVLAKIDDALYVADVAQAKAQVEQARAGVARAEADLGQLQAKMVQAERDWNRAKKLGRSEALSQADYDAAQSGYDVARANVEVGKAAINQAKETVAQARATLNRSQQNLDYCTIKSPVKGVIIDRRVNTGQTVVASLNAPSLFLIARDLKRLEVWVAVNEADIGSIRPGQPVSFTVDAFPGQVFQGQVGKVRLNATMTQNVVTYTVEVVTDNPGGVLLPYLTANVKFMLQEHRDTLLVPNAALRWTPRPDQMAQEVRSEKKAGHPGRKAAEGARAASTESSQGEFARGTLWVAEDNLARPVSVGVGPSDGTVTEVQGDAVKEGMTVIVGEQPKDAAPTSAASPFTPKLFRGGRH